MRRRRDRGHADAFIIACFASVLLMMIGLWGAHVHTHEQLKRLADAVAVYAPKAEEAP